MTRLLALSLAALLAACSGERAAEPPAESSVAAAPSPAVAASTRAGILADPTPTQVEAVAAHWTGKTVDLRSMLREEPAYRNAPEAERAAVLDRLTAERGAELQAAADVGRLELSAPVGQATYDAAKGVWHLPVFLPGSAVTLAPRHRLRLSNAEGAYRLAGDTAAGRAMTDQKVRPDRARLSVTLESVRPTEYGAEFVGRLDAFTLYDAQGRSLGETVRMTATAPSA